MKITEDKLQRFSELSVDDRVKVLKNMAPENARALGEAFKAYRTGSTEEIGTVPEMNDEGLESPSAFDQAKLPEGQRKYPKIPPLQKQPQVDPFPADPTYGGQFINRPMSIADGATQDKAGQALFDQENNIRPNRYLKNPEASMERQRQMVRAGEVQKTVAPKTIENTVRLAQKTVGAPLAKRVSDANAETFKSAPPWAKVLGNQAEMMIGGPEMYGYGVKPDEYNQGEAQLKDTLGETGAEIAKSAVGESVNLINYTPLGIEAFGAKLAQHGVTKGHVLARIFLGPKSLELYGRASGNMLENVAIEGVAGSAMNDPALAERMLGAGVAGFGIPYAVAGAKGLVKGTAKGISKSVDIIDGTDLKKALGVLDPKQFQLEGAIVAPGGKRPMAVVDLGDGRGRIAWYGGRVDEFTYKTKEDYLKVEDAFAEKGALRDVDTPDWRRNKMTRPEKPPKKSKTKPVQEDLQLGPLDEVPESGEKRNLLVVTTGVDGQGGLTATESAELKRLQAEAKSSTAQRLDAGGNRQNGVAVAGEGTVDPETLKTLEMIHGDAEVGTQVGIGADDFRKTSSGWVNVSAMKRAADRTKRIVELVNKRDAPQARIETKLEEIPPVVRNDLPQNVRTGDKVVAVVGSKTRILGHVIGETAEGLEVADIRGNKYTVDRTAVSLTNKNDWMKMLVSASGHGDPKDKVVLALQSGAKMNIEEVAAITNRPLAEAHSVLEGLQKANLAKKTKDGYWTATRLTKHKKALPPPYLPSPNEKVYLLGRHGEHASVIVSAVNAEKNTATIKYRHDELAVTEVPLRNIRAIGTPGISREMNIVPEQDALPPFPGAFAGQDIQDYGLVHDLLKRLASKEHIVGRVLDGLVWQGSKGAIYLRQAVREWTAAATFEKLKTAYRHEIARQFPEKKLYDEFYKDIHHFAEGNVPNADMVQKYGDTWVNGRAFVKNLIAQSRELEREIVAQGGVGEDKLLGRVFGNEDHYVARHFMAYLDPEGWYKRVPAKVMQDTIQFFQNTYKNESWTYDEMAEELGRILKTNDPINTFRESRLGKAFHNLKTRQDIPKQLRLFMGEIDNGLLSLPQTLANQRAILQNLRMWNTAMEDPRLFSPGPRPAEKFVRLPEDPKRFGKAAGGYVHPALHSAMTSVDNSKNPVIRSVQQLTSYMKGNNVATLRAVVNSTFGNLYSVGLMGDRGLTFGNAKMYLHAATRALKDYKRNPSNMKEGHVVEEAVRYGMHLGGQTENELGFGNVLATLEELYGSKDMSHPIDSLRGLMEIAAKYNPISGARFFQRKFGAILDSNDAVFRMANYMSAKQVYLSRGLSVEEACRAAMHDVNESFWNQERVGRTVEAARKNGVGLVARFFTAATEDMKLHVNAVKRSKEDPSVAARLIGMSAFTGLFVGTMNTLYGEDLKNMTKRSRAYRALVASLPFKDPTTGGQAILDLTTYVPAARFFTGNPEDSTFAKVTANLFLQPVEGGALESPMRELMSRFGWIRPEAPPRRILEGEEGFVKALDWAWKQGALPSMLYNSYSAYQQTKQQGAMDPRISVPTALAKQAVNIDVAPDTLEWKAKELKAELSEMDKQIALAKRTGKQDLIPGMNERKKKLVQQFIQERKQ